MHQKRIFIGTSGWTYDDWSGRFYPQPLKAADRLGFYARQFNTVEINATFYRLPTMAMIQAWNRNLTPPFHLVVKGSRFITHRKKLNDCQAPLKTFLKPVLGLHCLKVILWQLPPFLHKDLDRLNRFLCFLPKSVRHAVEFRHESWWDAETTTLLKQHAAAFVAVSHPRLPDTIYATTDFLYLRFHGMDNQLYQSNYPRPVLAQWAQRLQLYLQKGLSLYAFFNNDYHAHAPNNALLFRELLTADEG